jgi:hypothetical protein
VVSEEGTHIMYEQREGVGWYADPAGTQELRYFDGHWTDQVAARGVVSTQPLLLASPASAADDTAALTGGKRPTKLWALTAAGAAAITAVIVLAVRPSHSGASFCADYAALGGVTASASLNDGGIATVRKLAGMFQTLAGEAPAAAKADLTLLANDMSALERTGIPAVSDEDAQAAADRVDAVAQRPCNG